MGWFYHTGKGPKKDLDEAERWYVMSAQQGMEEAAKNLEILRNDRKAARSKKP